jgi:hypothetical protein
VRINERRSHPFVCSVATLDVGGSDSELSIRSGGRVDKIGTGDCETDNIIQQRNLGVSLAVLVFEDGFPGDWPSFRLSPLLAMRDKGYFSI